MTRIRQQAYFRQRVLKDIEKRKNISAVSRRYRVSRTSIYRWKARYDGTVESLMEKSHRPHSHPSQHTIEELRMIRKAWGYYKNYGLVCFHMILQDKFGYTRSICSLNRAMRKLDIGRKKQRRKRHVPKPYDTPKVAGERVQIDVKYVPRECLLPGMKKLYQFTAVDECTRLRCRMIYEEHTSWSAEKFMRHVQKRFPFEIQCVQTDNGFEFTNALKNCNSKTEFEEYLEEAGIRHKRIKVATPRHNGKVERVHRIDQERFYTDRVFYSLEDANEQLQRYQRQDNNFPLLVLGRKSPKQYWKELSA
jgi:transposase